jgi:hypothetical protein
MLNRISREGKLDSHLFGSCTSKFSKQMRLLFIGSFLTFKDFIGNFIVYNLRNEFLKGDFRG